MKFLSVIGARPDFVQVGILSKAMRERHQEIMVHTGQHYDDDMSDVFFRELGLPAPEINLAVGSNSLSAQTGEILVRLGEVLRAEDPDAVIVRGDTSGTIAGSIAAKQGLYPLVHIEAGCRSYDRTMPEEINRVVSDHLADVCITTDEETLAHLRAEGISSRIFSSGDVMFDTYISAVRGLGNRARPSTVPAEPYDLLTIHRAENTDNEVRLREMLEAFSIAPRRVVFPAHPRTRKAIAHFGISLPHTIALVEPLGYLDMIVAERGATQIFTDSGGVQREAYFGSVPCITLRDNTEWTNTVDAGWNRLAPSGEQIRHFLLNPATRPATHPPLFGDGNATRKIIEILESEDFVTVVSDSRKTREARRR